MDTIVDLDAESEYLRSHRCACYAASTGSDAIVVPISITLARPWRGSALLYWQDGRARQMLSGLARIGRPVVISNLVDARPTVAAASHCGRFLASIYSVMHRDLAGGSGHKRAFGYRIITVGQRQYARSTWSFQLDVPFSAACPVVG